MSTEEGTQSPRREPGRGLSTKNTGVDSTQNGARWWLSRWLPVIFFVFSTVVLMVSWRAFLVSEASAREMESRVTTEQVKLRLEAWIRTRLAVVEQMASNWTRDYQGDPGAFRKAAGDLIELYPGFQALNWIDKDWVIRIVVPETSNEAALGKDLHHHPSLGVPAGLERAMLEPKITVTPVIRLLQGGWGFASYRRVVGDDGGTLGYINGVFRINTLVDACLAEEGLRRRFSLQLLDENGSVAYSHGFEGNSVSARQVVLTPIQIGDRLWELRMTRSDGASNGKGEALAAVLLACALLLAAILSLALSALIRRHGDYQQSVATFRHLLGHLRDLVVRMDAEGRVRYASPAYRQLLGRDQNLKDHDALLFIHGGDREARMRTLDGILQPPHLRSVEQRILSARNWHRIAWELIGIPGEDGSLQVLLALGRELDTETPLEVVDHD